MYLTIKLERKDYMSLSQCIRYVKRQLEWETAMVEKISHDNKVIPNRKYSYNDFPINRGSQQLVCN